MQTDFPPIVQDVFERADAYFQQGPLRRGLRSVFWGLRQHHAARAASAMAFSLFLASIPMLALGGWLFAEVLSRDPRGVGYASSLLDLAPSEVRALLDAHMARLSGKALAPIVLVGSLWLASGAFHTVMAVFETALAATRRPWWIKRVIAMGCVAGAFVGAVMSASVAILLAGGPTAIFGRLAEDGSGAREMISLGVAVTTTTLLVGGFFRISVTRPGVKRRVWPGASVTVSIGTIASFVFAKFVGELARYAVFYGSLAAVAVFLIWLWICCVALLVGAEVNAQLEGVRRESIPPSRGA